MSDVLRSVGLDVGTTTTQMILSELRVENQAGSFTIPELKITERKILYKSEVHFTPLLRGELVDAAALRGIIESEYSQAGIRREDVDTGAIIITGETSRKENAAAVLQELSGFAGDFVVATAGPELESVLAAKGAGADSYSERTGKTVLHMDIGGGTSNLALIRDGKIVAAGCMNVGGRLVKWNRDGQAVYLSPVLEDWCGISAGAQVTKEQLIPIARQLTEGLEMAAGLRERTPLLDRLWTKEMGEGSCKAFCDACSEGNDLVISFSGGVADCIARSVPWTEYGDMGPVLGDVIRASKLCSGAYVLGEETIRATVIGAGCHSACLSGSTVFYRNVSFPLKNLPVAQYGQYRQHGEETCVLSMPGIPSPGYEQVKALAEKILKLCPHGPVYVCTEQDMAKALGQVLALMTQPDRSILCIDRVKLPQESYLDVGSPVGPALPVVVKTLILSR